MAYKIKGELEVEKGIGLPSLTTAQRLAYTPPKEGYTVFDTDLQAEFIWRDAAWASDALDIDDLDTRLAAVEMVADANKLGHYLGIVADVPSLSTLTPDAELDWAQVDGVGEYYWDGAAWQVRRLYPVRYIHPQDAGALAAGTADPVAILANLADGQAYHFSTIFGDVTLETDRDISYAINGDSLYQPANPSATPQNSFTIPNGVNGFMTRSASGLIFVSYSNVEIPEERTGVQVQLGEWSAVAGMVATNTTFEGYPAVRLQGDTGTWSYLNTTESVPGANEDRTVKIKWGLDDQATANSALRLGRSGFVADLIFDAVNETAYPASGQGTRVIDIETRVSGRVAETTATFLGQSTPFSTWAWYADYGLAGSTTSNNSATGGITLLEVDLNFNKVEDIAPITQTFQSMNGTVSIGSDVSFDGYPVTTITDDSNTVAQYLQFRVENSAFEAMDFIEFDLEVVGPQSGHPMFSVTNNIAANGWLMYLNLDSLEVTAVNNGNTSLAVAAKVVSRDTSRAGVTAYKVRVYHQGTNFVYLFPSYWDGTNTVLDTSATGTLRVRGYREGSAADLSPLTAQINAFNGFLGNTGWRRDNVVDGINLVDGRIPTIVTDDLNSFRAFEIPIPNQSGRRNLIIEYKTGQGQHVFTISGGEIATTNGVNNPDRNAFILDTDLQTVTQGFQGTAISVVSEENFKISPNIWRYVLTFDTVATETHFIFRSSGDAANPSEALLFAVDIEKAVENPTFSDEESFYINFACRRSEPEVTEYSFTANGQPVFDWADVQTVDGQLTIQGDTLSHEGGNTSWDSGVSSLSKTRSVEHVVQQLPNGNQTGRYVFGLSRTQGVPTAPQGFDYALFLTNTVYRIFENGSSIAANVDPSVNVSIGDVCEVRVNNGAVEYVVNGAVIHTSTQPVLTVEGEVQDVHDRLEVLEFRQDADGTGFWVEQVTPITGPFADGVEVRAFPDFTTSTLVTAAANPTQAIDLGVDLSEVDFLDVSITANNSGEETRRLDLREFVYDAAQGGLLHWWDANGIRVRINTADISVGRIYVAYLNTSSMRIERIQFRKLVDTTVTPLHRTKLVLAADTPLATATQTQLGFDTVEYDVGGIADLDSNQVVIASAGFYELDASIFNIGSNRVAQVFIYVNGNLVARDITAITSGDQTVSYSPRASTKVELIKGDIVTAEYYAHTAATTASAMTHLTVNQLAANSTTSATVLYDDLAHFKATRSGDQSVPNNVNTKLTGWNVEQDTAGAFLNDEFAAPESAEYHLSAAVRLDPANFAQINGESTILVFVDGIEAIRGGVHISGGSFFDGNDFLYGSVSGKITLAKGNKVSIEVLNGANGAANVNPATSITYWHISQVTSKTVINTTDIPVDDQAASGHMDIGTMRIQWGTGTSGSTVSFAVPFGSPPVVTGTIQFNQDRLFTLNTVTENAFDGVSWNTGANVASSGENFYWQAIGLKP